MFAFKNKYFLIIENTKDIELSNLKSFKKFSIIYRYKNKPQELSKLLQFRRQCKIKKIEFYIANNHKLMKTVKADGLYISAHNKNLDLKRFKNSNIKLIGSAHNIKELNFKILQGCNMVIFSRLFETSYEYKKGHLGVIKFNLLKISIKKDLTPLGGIRLSNLNKLNMVNCSSFAISSEAKKKPARIFSRLF
jgi:thiamine-phosphate pyrophosphorylase